MTKRVRVRFAPSPTGGLHLGGVRTVLYNYLFARRNDGDFILRIEDTDQTRYVEGAEQYIYDCLKWCGLSPDESPQAGGPHAPYRQSERKQLYAQYAQRLLDSGHAYYAFDTPEELEAMRNQKTDDGAPIQYDHRNRLRMRNSLSLPPDEVTRLLNAGERRVVRINMPENETITFTDMIRGEIHFDSNIVDDKVLLKADGMPTYHLAVVVDDYLMQITHAFRGEEWLPSAPVHLLLWKYLGWAEHMPQWAHLPLILKPDGNGKLSKRDGDRLGFPVFAMNWEDPKTHEVTRGFREIGFLPEAFVNMLAMLGWNDGTGQELLTMEELIDRFSMDRVHKGGAKFDFEKAKWFNQQHILRADDERLAMLALPYFEERGVTPDLGLLRAVVALIKERCHLLSDFYAQGHFFFKAPDQVDLATIKQKWNTAGTTFFEDWMTQLNQIDEWTHTALEFSFSELAREKGIKKGDLMLPLRIMLVGGKYGPGVFNIIELIGREETKSRIKNTLVQL
jgi:glutamyl-tRNA synthetase